ncbi:DUF4974 domain-containing protein [Chitinophaga sp. SYP-B3965]|uniref:FecR family protein n=1 Tax=Chitinophaga sp. SYP-B3965 TaxID=2663120 RepID=UPI0012998EF8|nr:FecR domain-containing protein [Chitinophaga sp. SYP-B3965]MRG45275.1 DUF4974 domain-containing protein [Chitinophaga sp. SYP-B3965]
MISKEDITALLKQYESGACSPKEKVLLERWFAERQASSGWQWSSEEERLQVQQLMRAYIEDQIFRKQPKKRSAGIFTLKKIAIAASLLLCFLAAAWLFRMNSPAKKVERFYTEKAVKPGSHAARLTLPDGSEIPLDDTTAGVLFNKGGVKISKLANGQLVYDAPFRQENVDTGNNTLSIPRGGQYRITLPDGTIVWLNSATSLTWPVTFNGKERVVLLSGEAYFDVAKNSEQPFKVKAGHAEILATGTSFNISAYEDEDKVSTTLVEGGVNVTVPNSMVNLKPGQQAIIFSGSSSIQKKEVDTDQALAWMQGNFLFEDQDIRSIMRNIARWYNVEISFEGKPNPMKFGGTYSRSKGLEELLKHLESLSGIRFRINNNKVTVLM